MIHLVFTDENEDIKGKWVDAEIKPEPEGELSTGFIDKRTNIWYNVNRKTNKYKK